MMNGWQHVGSFVVRFGRDTAANAGRYYGRAEHVASGQTTRFESLEELLEFFNRVLKEMHEELRDSETLSDYFPTQTNDASET